MFQYPGGPAGYQQPAAMGPPPMQPIYPQQAQTVYAQGAFDAGARFDGVSQPRIPVRFIYMGESFQDFEADFP